MSKETNVAKKKSRTRQYHLYIGLKHNDEIEDVRMFSGNKSSTLLFINKHYSRHQLKYKDDVSYETVINFYSVDDDGSIDNELGWLTIDELITQKIIGV